MFIETFNESWRAIHSREGFDAQQFTIDCEAKQAMCPAGRSIIWTSVVDNRDNDAIKNKFATTNYSVCTAQLYTHDPATPDLTIRPQSIPSVPGDSCPANDRTVQGAICHAIGYRKHILTRDTDVQVSARMLHRLGANLFQECPDGERDEFHPDQPVAQ